MWKRTKNAGQTPGRLSFSLVHQYIQHFNEVSGNKSALIRRRSKLPGVIITQNIPNLPEGKSTPDFQCKPIPLSIQGGKLAVFKAVVTGDPKPEVSWRRTKGNLADKEKFQSKYDESTGEHILEIRKVTAAEADTYKCYAVNEYGKAICGATLNVTDGQTDPSDFRKLLRRKKGGEVEENLTNKEQDEHDRRFWDAMLNAEKKDYERICADFGVSDIHSVLGKLEEKRREKALKKSKDGTGPGDDISAAENCLKSGGSARDFRCKGQEQKDKDVNHVDAEDIDLILADFKLSHLDFVVKIQEVTAQEGDDALFECVLTHPLPKVTWMKKGDTLESGEKYNVVVSQHKLIHRLLIKDCTHADKGIYSVVAGSTSCSAWLILKAERDFSSAGVKKSRKKAVVGGAGIDLEEVAREQKTKNREEMEELSAGVQGKHEAGRPTDKTSSTLGGAAESGGVNGPPEKALFSFRESDKKQGSGRSSPGDSSKVTGEPCGSLKTLQGDASGSKSVLMIVTEEEDIRTGMSASEKVRKIPATLTAPERRRKEKPSSGTIPEDAELSQKLAGSARHSNRKKKTRQKKKQLGPNQEEDYSDDSEASADLVGHSSGLKRSKMPKGDSMCLEEHSECTETDGGAEGDTHSRPKKHVRLKKDKVTGEGVCPEDLSECTGTEDEGSTSPRRKKHRRRTENVVTGEGICLEDLSECTGTEDEGGTSSRRKKHSRLTEDVVTGESVCPEDHGECVGTEDEGGTRLRRKKHVHLIEDAVADPGVHFICGLSDVSCIIGEAAELTCKLSSEDCEGAWFRDRKKLSPDDNFRITKDGAIHTLVIIGCQEEHSGKYRFEADNRKTEAMVNVKDPPRFDPEELSAFTQPLTVKVGHNAIFKLHFIGHAPIKIQWYKEGEELQEDGVTKIEKSACHTRLLLTRLQRKGTGEIKIKLKNEHGFAEAVSRLIVLDKPTPPLGPAEVTESSAVCIEFRWRPPKDDGGSPVTNYIMERQQFGRNTWKKKGEIPGVPEYRDTEVEHGRKYCYRIRAVTAEGVSEVLETEEMQAGTLAFPGPPAPPKVDSAFDNCINLSWAPPSNRGGSHILGYILEKRKKGSNLWTVVNASDELIKEKKYAVKDVVAGMEYEFRVTAINLSGAGEFSNPCEFVFARDPKKPPGKVTGLRVTETSYSHFVLTWNKPQEKVDVQDEAKGYFVEMRQAECLEWSRCNSSPIIMTSYSVKGLKSMDMYWVRVIATNDGGDGEPQELSNYVLAMPSLVRPKFTNRKMMSFTVVRAGNSVRITINFEASPRPEIIWLKDNVPLTKRATISNSDGSSQLLIPSSERGDSGIYSILVKNLAGQETFSTEVRVTDDPKPPGPVELEENVPGTVTVIWEASPDEKRDDRLHYTVSKLDSTKRTWATVADRLFNNKFTVCNIMAGREYHFRVYAKNDMGVSAPSESPIWGTKKKREKFLVSTPAAKDRDRRCAPAFIVPLKFHTAPKGYECYMSCAVQGNPSPRVTWYRDHISLNTDTNYYISNTCGVCSMLILRVGPRDMGEYVVCAENPLGRAECSTTLSVRD